MGKKSPIQDNLVPEYIFEASWEVCNKVGGIFTVLSSKAKTMQTLYKENVFFIGPDIWKTEKNPWFIEDKKMMSEWVKHTKKNDKLELKTGYWDVPGKPKVILVNFTPFYQEKDKIYSQMWQKFQVNSLEAYGDYDEACMFSIAAGKTIESFYKFHGLEKNRVVAHFDEWTLGMGLLYVKDQLPKVATVFTTHATTVGRSIAFNGKPLYSQLNNYNGDQMARELNVVSKHSVEKAAAQNADCFTTVSGATQCEAKVLLECEGVVTPNGFEKTMVATGSEYTKKRQAARKTMIRVAECLTGMQIDKNTLLIATSGRYEYRNKGIDVFIDAVNRIKYRECMRKKVIAFIMVPAWVGEPRADLIERLNGDTNFETPLDSPYLTHNLHDESHDPVINQLKHLYLAQPTDNVKLIFVPSYLNGLDGIFNLPYYDLLIGMDATVFPSYYEPWGYTPHESIAFSVPTVTTSLAGFGIWAMETGEYQTMMQGVRVIHRDDDNFDYVSDNICKAICELSSMSGKELEEARLHTFEKAETADWEHFFKHYEEVYCKALHKVINK